MLSGYAAFAAGRGTRVSGYIVTMSTYSGFGGSCRGICMHEVVLDILGYLYSGGTPGHLMAPSWFILQEHLRVLASVEGGHG